MTKGTVGNVSFLFGPSLIMFMCLLGGPSLYGNSLFRLHALVPACLPSALHASSAFDDDVVFDRQCGFVCDGGRREGCENIKFEKGDPLSLSLSLSRSILSIELSIDRSIDLAAAAAASG